MNFEQELKEIQKDIRNLKLKAFEPDKTLAQFFQKHLCWEDTDAKRNLEKCYAKEFEIFNEWLKIYCEEHGCSKEDALQKIVEES